VSHNTDRECYQLIPLSLTVLQEKAIRIYEAVKEEIAILAKEEGFQDVSGDDIVKLLESFSLPLTNEEMAEMDIRT
jgi:hypothetical protein